MQANQFVQPPIPGSSQRCIDNFNSWRPYSGPCMLDGEIVQQDCTGLVPTNLASRYLPYIVQGSCPLDQKQVVCKRYSSEVFNLADKFDCCFEPEQDMANCPLGFCPGNQNCIDLASRLDALCDSRVDLGCGTTSQYCQLKDAETDMGARCRAYLLFKQTFPELSIATRGLTDVKKDYITPRTIKRATTSSSATAGYVIGVIALIVIVAYLLYAYLPRNTKQRK